MRSCFVSKSILHGELLDINLSQKVALPASSKLQAAFLNSKTPGYGEVVGRLYFQLAQPAYLPVTGAAPGCSVRPSQSKNTRFHSTAFWGF